MVTLLSKKVPRKLQYRSGGALPAVTRGWFRRWISTNVRSKTGRFRLSQSTASSFSSR